MLLYVAVALVAIGALLVVGMRTSLLPSGAAPTATPPLAEQTLERTPELEPSRLVTVTVAPDGTASASAGATGSPLATRSPAVGLTEAERQGQAVSGPRFDACSSFSTTVDEGAPTIEYAARSAEHTVVGEILEIGGGRYNVSSGELTGERPVDMFDVYRASIVDVEVVVTGTAQDGLIKVRLPGGQIGCDLYENNRTSAVGGPGRYVLFLSDVPDRRGNAVSELTIVRAWEINDSSRVVTPYDGEVPVEDFIDRVRAL